MNIYHQNEINFDNNGLGFLTDVINAKVEDNLNGNYSLSFEYKLKGHLNEYLQNENIIKCKVADGTKQLFIIKNVVKTFNSIQVTCKHIFYQLLDNFVEDVAPINLSPQQFLTWILNKANYKTNFKVYSDISTPKSARYVRRNPVDCILGDTDNSMVNLFGGELKRDNFDIRFNKSVGNDNGVKLIVGKNITGINISIDTSSVHTRIMPQGHDGLFLPEKYVDSPLIDNYLYPKVYKVEFSDIKYDPEADDAYHSLNEVYAALRNATNELYSSGVDKPIINVKTDWRELSKTNEYKDYSNLERVNLGDTITVDLLGFSYKSKVIKTIYNVLTDKIESFEVGSPLANIGTSTNSIKREVEKINPTSILEEAKDSATKMLTQAMGGYVVKTQNELLIMDTNDVNTAKKIWRWNMNGLGYSESGIDGPYGTAITADGQIVADFITTGKLDTNVIEGYESLILNVSNQDKKIAQISMTMDEINSKLSEQMDLTVSGESTKASLELININQSEPITIKVKPIGESISYLYPRNNLFPSNNLFLKDRKIRFKNKTTNESFDYELPDNLLYYDENNYDEFYLSYETLTCQVIKKCKYNADGTISLLENSIVKDYDYPTINLTDGDYEVSVLGYKDAYLYVTLMAANIYTTQFATRTELSSEITQTKNMINLEVKQINTLVDKEVSTLYSQINQTSKSILLEVSEKYATKETTNELSSQISQTSKSILLEVSQKYATKETTNELSTRIQQSAKSIELSATDNKNTAKLTIRLKDEAGNTLDTKTANIQMTGLVSFTDLQGKGTTTIDGSNINTGTLTAVSINLGNGKFSVDTNGVLTSTSGHIGGWSIGTDRIAKNTSSGKYAVGIIAGGNDGDTIFHTYSSALQRNTFYVTNTGALYCENANIKGKVTATSGSFTGTINATSGRFGIWELDDNKYLRGEDNDGNTLVISPTSVNQTTPDGDVYAAPWKYIIRAASDKRLKDNINIIEDKYENLYDDLKPLTFNYNKKYDDEGCEKIHFGFVAQDILKSAQDNNLENLYLVYKNGTYYNLDKQEIIALNTWQIQKIKKQIKDQDGTIQELTKKIKKLEECICQ